MKQLRYSIAKDTFAARLKKVRRQRKMTTKELGSLVGRTDIQIQRYEAGKSGQLPTVDIVRKLCIVLQVSPLWLIAIDEIDCKTNPEDGYIYDYAVETRGVEKTPTLSWTCPSCNFHNIMYEYNEKEFQGTSCEYSGCNKVFLHLFKTPECVK